MTKKKIVDKENWTINWEPVQSPRKPEPPEVLIKTWVFLQGNIDGYSLEDLNAIAAAKNLLPSEIRINTDYGYEDSPSDAFLEYAVTKVNSKYETQLKKYERDLIKYEKQLKEYDETIAEWLKWKTEFIEARSSEVLKREKQEYLRLKKKFEKDEHLNFLVHAFQHEEEEVLKITDIHKRVFDCNDFIRRQNEVENAESSLLDD